MGLAVCEMQMASPFIMHLEKYMRGISYFLIYPADKINETNYTYD